jgi:hypothetical protein
MNVHPSEGLWKRNFLFSHLTLRFVHLTLPVNVYFLVEEILGSCAHLAWIKPVRRSQDLFGLQPRSIQLVLLKHGVVLQLQALKVVGGRTASR